MIRTVLFDLDGTLTDSCPGILNSVAYALEKMGRPVPEREVLLQFIGPPLLDSYMRYCGFTKAEAKEGVRLFRERYVPIGKFENAPAPGAAEMLSRLREKGYTLALASSKPRSMCLPICERFGFAPYFTAIVGSPEEGDWTKDRVVWETVRALGLEGSRREDILMVGDRKFDVEGARAQGIACAGVEFFGYADPGELEEAGAAVVVKTVEALERYILTH